MAWDVIENYPPERMWLLNYFKSTGLNGKISESFPLDPAKTTIKRFSLQEIRMHFSAAFPSVEYLVAYISSIKGSAHNIQLISQLMSGSTDFILYYSNPRQLVSGDQIVISLSTTSGACVIGLHIQGWGVVG